MSITKGEILFVYMSNKHKIGIKSRIYNRNTAWNVKNISGKPSLLLQILLQIYG